MSVVMLAVLLVGTCASAMVLTYVVRNFAIARGLVHSPTPGRHLHEVPIPRVGGVAIFLTTWVFVAVVVIARGEIGSRPLLGLFASSVIVFALGLYDDLRGVPPWAKIGVQVIAAMVLYLSGIRIARVPIVFGDADLSTALSLAVTVAWVLWITNALNLIDGLDGLAAGSALFSAIVIFVIALVTGNGPVAILTLALAGAIAGFLRYNFNPATIFLGDSGSLFIGFMLSAVAVLGSVKAPTLIAIAIPLVSLGLPIVDASVAVVRRFLSGKPLFTPDRDHIHHRLLVRGLSHRGAVLVLYAVSAAFGTLSLLILAGPESRIVGIVLLVVGFGVFAGLQQLRYDEFSELRRAAQWALIQKQVIANNLVIRRSSEELNRCNTLAEISSLLANTLEPLGFCGVSLSGPCASDLPLREGRAYVDLRGDLHLFWNGVARPSDAACSISFSLPDSAGTVSFHRANTNAPVVSLDVFSNSGFLVALQAALARSQSNSQIATASD